MLEFQKVIEGNFVNWKTYKHFIEKKHSKIIFLGYEVFCKFFEWKIVKCGSKIYQNVTRKKPRKSGTHKLESSCHAFDFFAGLDGILIETRATFSWLLNECHCLKKKYSDFSFEYMQRSCNSFKNVQCWFWLFSFHVSNIERKSLIQHSCFLHKICLWTICKVFTLNFLPFCRN